MRGDFRLDVEKTEFFVMQRDLCAIFEISTLILKRLNPECFTMIQEIHS